MSNGFITPIQFTNPFDNGENTSKVKGQSGSELFKDVFQNAIDNVVTTDKELTNQEYLLATGQIDDAHTIPIAAAQAQLSIDLLVQLRNKALESYNQIMNINV